MDSQKIARVADGLGRATWKQHHTLKDVKGDWDRISEVDKSIREAPAESSEEDESRREGQQRITKEKPKEI